MIETKKAIIWDWNGTLLDDTAICIESMNELLEVRNLELLNHAKYSEIFTFPVRDYYLHAGFDLEAEAFEGPAMDFIRRYHKRLPEAALHEGVPEILACLKKKGFSQSVLSAMEHDSLLDSMRQKGVAHFFDHITGISDHYAHSKLEIGEMLMQELVYPAEQVLIVGDTLHDLEVGEGLGIEVLLIANGHQSYARLRARTRHVLHNLGEFRRLIDETLCV